MHLVIKITIKKNLFHISARNKNISSKNCNQNINLRKFQYRFKLFCYYFIINLLKGKNNYKYI